MEHSVEPLAALAGAYEGEGAWHDEAGDSRRYRIEMRFAPAPDGQMRHWFRHVFFEEGSETEQAVLLVSDRSGVVAAGLENVQISGRGYISGGALHYELDVPGNRVEVTHLFDKTGAVHVLGSSQRNAQGRYIWWEERLRRRDTG